MGVDSFSIGYVLPSPYVILQLPLTCLPVNFLCGVFTDKTSNHCTLGAQWKDGCPAGNIIPLFQLSGFVPKDNVTCHDDILCMGFMYSSSPNSAYIFSDCVTSNKVLRRLTLWRVFKKDHNITMLSHQTHHSTSKA